MAIKEKSQSAFAMPAKEVGKLLTELEAELHAASVSRKHQHWVMFSVVLAYQCCRQCYALLHDERRLQQARCVAVLSAGLFVNLP